jgi:phage shock protein PspC (stress-responsive transcriptional regulator)
MTNSKTLHRSDNRMVAGVCAGIAEYFGVDVTLVRILTAVIVIFGGTGLLLYVAAWLIMPDSSGATVINWRGQNQNPQASPPPSGDTTQEPPFSV